MSKLSPDSLRELRTLHQFIGILTDVDPDEALMYADEVRSDTRFQDSLNQKSNGSGSGHYGSWFPSIGSMLGQMIYVLVRICKPEKIVETGVASGGSSSYFLCALEKNGHGDLYSIDDPWGDSVGWSIPDYLKHRWHLTKGKSVAKLVPLLDDLGAIDIFMHDSDHSYENMFREYLTAWDSLSARGLLLSHNIDENSAFPDFCEEKDVKGFILTNMGGAVKC